MGGKTPIRNRNDSPDKERPVAVREGTPMGKAQLFGRPPDVDELLIEDYARPGTGGGAPRLIYRIELDVPITKDWTELQNAVTEHRTADTYKLVLDNIQKDKQSPRVLNVLAAAFADDRGSPPDVDHQLLEDYARPGRSTPRRSYRIELDIPIRVTDWSNLEAAVAANKNGKNSQPTYDIVYDNIDADMRSTIAINVLTAALGLK